jgi:hypothetical protein
MFGWFVLLGDAAQISVVPTNLPYGETINFTDPN